MLTGDYPVLAERRLAPVSARFPRRARRDPAQLPTLEPGTVFVFEVDGEYRQPAVRRHLRGSEPDVVRAVAVSLIDMRPRLVPVEVVIASGSAGYDFRVLATFRCRVIHAPAAAAASLRGVGELLAEHVGRDRELLRIGTYYGVEEMPRARTRIHTQVRAYCMVAPPQLPGLEVVLATVEVSPVVLEMVDDNYATLEGPETAAAEGTTLDDADDLVVVDVGALNEPCIDLLEAAPTFSPATASTLDVDARAATHVAATHRFYAEDIDAEDTDAEDTDAEDTDAEDTDADVYDIHDDDRGAGRGWDEDELVGGSADR